MTLSAFIVNVSLDVGIVVVVVVVVVVINGFPTVCSDVFFLFSMCSRRW